MSSFQKQYYLLIREKLPFGIINYKYLLAFWKKEENANCQGEERKLQVGHTIDRRKEIRSCVTYAGSERQRQCPLASFYEDAKTWQGNICPKQKTKKYTDT